MRRSNSTVMVKYFNTTNSKHKNIHAYGHDTHCSMILAAAIITSVAAIKINPNVAWSCKPTIIRGGGVATNIIPDIAEVTFDIRSQTNEDMTLLLDKVRCVAENVAAAYGASAEVILPDSIIPAATLDEELTAEAAECIKEVVGEDKLAPELNNPAAKISTITQKPILSLKQLTSV